MQTFEKHLAQARKLFEEQKLEEASAAYLKAINMDPPKEQKAIAWAELCWLFYHQKNYEGCIEAAGNVLHFDSNYEAKEDLLRLKGFSAAALGHDEEALESLEESLKVDSGSEKQQLALFELIKIQFRQQMYDACLQRIEQAESYFYQNEKEYWLSLLFFKGFAHYYMDKPDEAEKVFEELLENASTDSRRATAFFGLAFISFHRKNYLNTINLCESVTKHDSAFFDMESVGFLTAASFRYLGRKDVFTQYYHQLKNKYPEGRYKAELEKLRLDGNGKE